MTCECCKESHDGSYGSGRFCSQKCARSFSTKSKRSEISSKVSKSLMGRNVGGSWTDHHRKQSIITRTSNTWLSPLVGMSRERRRKKLEAMFEGKQFKTRGQSRIRELLAEFGYEKDRCEECDLGKEWNGQELILHLDHINGNFRDNRLENLRYLCPNCHSQTETFLAKNWMRKL